MSLSVTWSGQRFKPRPWTCSSSIVRVQVQDTKLLDSWLRQATGLSCGYHPLFDVPLKVWVKMSIFKWFAENLGTVPGVNSSAPSIFGVDSTLFVVLVVVCNSVPYLICEFWIVFAFLELCLCTSPLEFVFGEKGHFCAPPPLYLYYTHHVHDRWVSDWLGKPCTVYSVCAKQEMKKNLIQYQYNFYLLVHLSLLVCLSFNFSICKLSPH